MATKHIRVPVLTHNREDWGCLNYIGVTNFHIIVGETLKIEDNSFSFIGGHRVRRIKIKGNVHWLIPSGIDLDISEVSPKKQATRRNQGG